jgi:16S rRNA (uracil1498-N3)-methyltransferase
MRQYVLPNDYDYSGLLEISGEDYRYLTRVLRKRPGERFAGADPRGNRVSILLRESGQSSCILEITADTGDTGISVVDITLFQCIPKARKMDTIVRQAVEAGVGRIIPVQSENTVPRYDEEIGEKKRQRWLRIARQAMQQSGRQKAVEIEMPVSLQEIPRVWGTISAPGDVCLVFHEKQLSTTTLHGILSPPPAGIGICIGPEGGFSPDEAATLLHSGFQPVYINTNILRTETAALYAIAAVQTVILEKDSWTVR